MFGSQYALQVNLFMTVLSNCLWLWSIESVHGQGVHIRLNGRIIEENGSVNITDIGESDAAVLCMTDKVGCCGDVQFGRAGEWLFPDSERVGTIGGDGDFYRDRGPGVVRLNRRNNATMPTGLFCCKIPDRNNVMQTICIIVESTITSDGDGSGAGMLPNSTTYTTAVPTTTTTTESMSTMTTVADATTTVETVSTQMITPVTDASTTSTTTDTTTVPPTTFIPATSLECDSTDLFLQLRLFEVQDCLEWVNVNANIKLNDISTAIISNINQLCQCGLSLENITNGVFRCFPASPQAVTFRAILHGGTKASSSELSSYIEQWIMNDVTIPVQSVLINVDSSCMVAISSFDDGECQIDSEQHTNNSSSAVIGGTVAGLLLLLILSSAAVISLVILKKKHHTSRDSKVQLQIPEANLTDSSNHEYEVIDKYTKEYRNIVEMDLTKCPAYEPMRT